jgi:hypothetical protein
MKYIPTSDLPAGLVTVAAAVFVAVSMGVRMLASVNIRKQLNRKSEVEEGGWTTYQLRWGCSGSEGIGGSSRSEGIRDCSQSEWIGGCSGSEWIGGCSGSEWIGGCSGSEGIGERDEDFQSSCENLAIA